MISESAGKTEQRGRPGLINPSVFKVTPEFYSERGSKARLHPNPRGPDMTHPMQYDHLHWCVCGIRRALHRHRTDRQEPKSAYVGQMTSGQTIPVPEGGVSGDKSRMKHFENIGVRRRDHGRFHPVAGRPATPL